MEDTENKLSSSSAFSYLQQKAIECLLQTNIDILDILDNISQSNQLPLQLLNKKEIADEDQFKLQSVYERISQIDELTVSENKLGDNILIPNIMQREKYKLKQIRSHLKYIFKKIIVENHTSNTFDTLISTINELKQIKLDEQRIIDETNTNVNDANQLKDLIKSERVEFSNTLNELDKKIVLLSDIKWDYRKENDIRQNFLEKWDKSRRYQLNLKEFLTLSQLSDECEKFDRIRNDEALIHTNIIKYINLDIDNMLAEIEVMQKKYITESLAKDMELKNLSDARQRIITITAKKLEEYRDQNIKMEDWLNQKAETKRQQELELRRKNAATKIQAWWRGTMVRRGFGPYKLKTSQGKGRKKTKK